MGRLFVGTRIDDSSSYRKLMKGLLYNLKLIVSKLTVLSTYGAFFRKIISDVL